jgi:hypothetical protein
VRNALGGHHTAVAWGCRKECAHVCSFQRPQVCSELRASARCGLVSVPVSATCYERPSVACLFSPEVSPLSTGIPHRPRHSILLRLCPSARSAPTWGQSRTLVGIGLFRPSMSCVIASRALRGPSGIHTSSGHEPPYYCAPRGDLPAQPALKQLHASQVRCPVGCAAPSPVTTRGCVCGGHSGGASADDIENVVRHSPLKSTLPNSEHELVLGPRQLVSPRLLTNLTVFVPNGYPGRSSCAPKELLCT